MIKNIILPQNIGSYYIFPKHILAIDIGRYDINAALCVARGYTRTIVQLVNEKIENNNGLSYEQRVVNALKTLKIKLKYYDSLNVTIPSSNVIFKELSLPIIGIKKIKMIVPFEVESLLPFNLDQAVIDCIVTKEDRKEKSSDILVAAVKKDYIEQFIKLFEEADLKVDKITVDIFELYALYKSIPKYQAINSITALVEVELNSTKIAIILNNQLKYIRVISKGLANIIKQVATNNQKDPNELLNNILHFGLNNLETEPLKLAAKEAFNELLQEIKFTILAYISKLKTQENLKLVLLTGSIADIPSISEFTEGIFETECQILEAKKIIHNGKIHSKINFIPNNFLVSIATALPSQITDDFNLYVDHKAKEESVILTYQIIALSLLTLLLLSTLSIYSFWRVRGIKKVVTQAESQAINELNKTFKLKKPTTIKEANSQALKELKKQETAWKQLSLTNRYSFLKYLSELSKCINAKQVQLVLTSIAMKEDTIKLYGSVPGYNQLTELQNQLQCPIFKPIPKLQDFNFKSEPIVLSIKTDEGI